ncbi:MAG TPA: NAD(P)/FAD-dependent oxidoreductase [Vicinamibacterales bacterium]
MADFEVDVLVVGAGPGGLYAAGRLARDGHRVLVCEEHESVGDPVHCTGIIAADSFDEFDLPRGVILNPLHRVRFISPSGTPITYSTPKAEAVVIDRSRFDRALADDARLAGASIATGTRVSGLNADHDCVRALAGSKTVRARLVVLASGATYGVQKRSRLGWPQHYLHTAQRELPASELHDVEMHFGRTIAPGGFAWAVPVARPEGPRVRVGVMTSHDAPRHFTAMLDRVGPRWGIQSDDVRPRLKILPLGAIAKTYANRLLAVGDAAGLVKPTTGGGIHYSVLSGSLAADVGSAALKADALDAGSLSVYERRWRSRLAREFDAQQELRRVAIGMSDDDIDALFELARTDGVMPLVRRTARFNEHRHLIKALFNHRPARRILLRSLLGSA